MTFDKNTGPGGIGFFWLAKLHFNYKAFFSFNEKKLMRTSSLTNSTKRFKKKVNHIFENLFSVNENTDFISIQIKNVDTIKEVVTNVISNFIKNIQKIVFT